MRCSPTRNRGAALRDAGGVLVGVTVAVGVGVNVAVSPGVDGGVGVSVGGGVGVSVDGGVREGVGVGGPLRTSAKFRVGWLRSSVMLTGSDWLAYPSADTSRLSTWQPYVSGRNRE